MRECSGMGYGGLVGGLVWKDTGRETPITCTRLRLRTTQRLIRRDASTRLRRLTAPCVCTGHSGVWAGPWSWTWLVLAVAPCLATTPGCRPSPLVLSRGEREASQMGLARVVCGSRVARTTPCQLPLDSARPADKAVDSTYVHMAGATRRFTGEA